jgi:enoyl-[acyl-carrier protein] reductase I
MTVSRALMAGKRGLIMGVANERSLAWGISKAVHAHGAELAFTYQGEALGKRVRPLAESIGSDFVHECDVTNEASLDAAFAAIKERWGRLDFAVHAIGYVDPSELRGQYVDTKRENFLTLTYYGAERVMPHYNVMGVAKAALEASVRYLAVDLGPRNIRVNAISAGPIKTLAASGIGDFRYILKWNQLNAPLRRNVTIEDVGGSGLYLLSELGRGVTCEVMHVDSGYHVVGMLAVDAAPQLAEMLSSFKTSSGG